jgi:hypothetical protein
MYTAQTPHITRSKGRALWAVALLPVALLLSGCQTAAGTGAALGGAGGAVLGNAVAKAAGGSRTAGTVIGGALGAITGAAVGDSKDQADARAARAEANAQAVAAQSQAQALGLTDIAQLSQQGITDNVIINQIRTSGVVYHLSYQDIIWLKKNMVSDAVVSEMQATATRVPVARRVYQRRPVYVMEPVRPRPAFGVSYTSYGR